MHETTESVLPEHRERLYPPTVALSMFMRQVLEADASCQNAVNGRAAQRAANGLPLAFVAAGTAGRASASLFRWSVRSRAKQAAFSEKALEPWLWRGRTMNLVVGEEFLLLLGGVPTHEARTTATGRGGDHRDYTYMTVGNRSLYCNARLDEGSEIPIRNVK